MRFFGKCLVAWVCLMMLVRAFVPEQVVVVYNRNEKNSRELAELYREVRGIPAENLVGLDVVDANEISRGDYEKKIAGVLREVYTKRGWWERAKDREGILGSIRNSRPVMVVMRGVPLRIPATLTPVPNQPLAGHDEAAVDSELAILGLEGISRDGVMKNPFFSSEKPFMESGLSYLLVVSRMDAASVETCRRMIRESVEVEKRGLWGMAYVDLAQKDPTGDGWLRSVAEQNTKAGIPTVVDVFPDTLPTNYPMTQAAWYFGWYAEHVNGPFLNSRMAFRKGAVAMHLHSFSAVQMRDPGKNWSAALLARGAVATVGNVYEPYLGLTHHFDVLQNRLLRGWTYGEACLASLPGLSWQAIALGDPLYRPFRGVAPESPTPEDRDFVALFVAARDWGVGSKKYLAKIGMAAKKTRSSVFCEAMGLGLLAGGDERGVVALKQARDYAVSPVERLRLDFENLAMLRAKNPNLAVREIDRLLLLYPGLPEAEALRGWRAILAPPPPAGR